MNECCFPKNCKQNYTSPISGKQGSFLEPWKNTRFISEFPQNLFLFPFAALTPWHQRVCPKFCSRLRRQSHPWWVLPVWVLWGGYQIQIFLMSPHDSFCSHTQSRSLSPAKTPTKGIFFWNEGIFFMTCLGNTLVPKLMLSLRHVQRQKWSAQNKKKKQKQVKTHGNITTDGWREDQSRKMLMPKLERLRDFTTFFWRNTKFRHQSVCVWGFVALPWRSTCFFFSDRGKTTSSWQVNPGSVGLFMLGWYQRRHQCSSVHMQR